MNLAYDIQGLDEMLARLSPELYSGPLRKFWERCAIAIENRAREKAPVDTGRLRASIGHEIEDADPPTWCKVGSNVEYAPYQEFGTGLITEGEGGKGGRHWPPAAAMDVWASRHGFASGAAAAAAIGRNGGVQPHPYLRPAFADSQGDIQSALGMLSKEIATNWSAK